MSNSPATDTVGRFDGLANVYDRHRPNYPATAIAHIWQRCQLHPGMLLVDIGSGTGISARQFAAAGLRVIGVEPNVDMRRAAEAAPLAPDAPPIEFRDGFADATRLTSSFVDVVLAAQAFHWFATDAALREFYRILKPGGWIVLVWNEQDRNNPFTDEYMQAMIRHSPQPAIAAQVNSREGAKLLRCPLFRNAQRIEFPNSQELAYEHLLGRACSASYAPREPQACRQLEADLISAFTRFRRENNKVILHYRCVVITACRPARPGQH